MTTDCINLLPITLGVFALLIFASNYASWKMTKNISPEYKENMSSISKWKLLFGDVTLPREVLTTRGLLWRKASIIFFLCLVLTGFSFPYFNNQGWFCGFTYPN
jgi:hypothetical protein